VTSSAHTRLVAAELHPGQVIPLDPQPRPLRNPRNMPAVDGGGQAAQVVAVAGLCQGDQQQVSVRHMP
jgi:hypothetical protein